MARSPRGLRFIGPERWENGQLIVTLSVAWWYWPVLIAQAVPQCGIPRWLWPVAVVYGTAAMWCPWRRRRSL